MIAIPLATLAVLLGVVAVILALEVFDFLRGRMGAPRRETPAASDPDSRK